MYRIALILPYFGKFQNYYKFWLQSCINNPSVDFFILTDDKDFIRNVKQQNVGGVYVLPYTLERLKKHFERILQTSICLKSPYKLCDYKPMYGLLFENYLKDYDFWGHCDNDLVFGNIRSFLTDDILSAYDRIFSRGHLSLYRNRHDVNRYFMKSEFCKDIPSWKKVVKSDKSFAFDEWPGVSCLWKTFDIKKMYDEIVFDDIFIAKKEFLSYQKMTQLDCGKSHFIFEYDNGELYRWYLNDKTGAISKEPTLYAHFQKRKMQVKTENVNRYLIVPNQFIENQNITKRDVLYYGRRYHFYVDYYKIRLKNLMRKML